MNRDLNPDTKLFNWKIDGSTELFVWNNDWQLKGCRYKRDLFHTHTFITVRIRRYHNSDTTDRENIEIDFKNVTPQEHEEICKQLYEHIQKEKFISEL